MLDLPTRRPCVTKEVGMGLSLTVSYQPMTAQPIEVLQKERGKAADKQMKEP